MPVAIQNHPVDAIATCKTIAIPNNNNIFSLVLRLSDACMHTNGWDLEREL